MTIEERLTEALHEADRFEPSPDLFARVGRSITEDLAHRRRLLRIYLSMLLGVVLSAGYFMLVVTPGPAGPTISAWETELFQLAVLGVLVIVLAPNIRRFARSYVADVFHLSPEAGDRFLAVLDIAYYLIFVGLMFVNADFGPPELELAFPAALDDVAAEVAFVLLAMGLLHALNIAALPFVGLIFNSVIRLAVRREAAEEAPPESLRALKADRVARAFVIALLVVVGALLLNLVAGVVIGVLQG